jgi:hypothetical protein
MRRKAGFSVKEDGVGGIAVVVPRARDAVGGVVGSSVRREAFSRNGKTYFFQLLEWLEGKAQLVDIRCKSCSVVSTASWRELCDSRTAPIGSA